MAKIKNLSRAPIVEAIFDIKAHLPHSFDVNEFETKSENLQDVFTKRSDIIEFRGGIGIGAQPPPTISTQFSGQKKIGKRFQNDDNSRVLQFKLDGFTFSMVNHYTNWEDFINISMDCLQTYLQITNPTDITRIALRYINHLILTLPVDLTEYLTTPPRTPLGGPNRLKGFITRTVSEDEKLGHFVNLIEAIDVGPSAETLKYIIDIDVYKQIAGSISIENMKKQFEILRETKNNIFFGSITEKTAELYS